MALGLRYVDVFMDVSPLAARMNGRPKLGSGDERPNGRFWVVLLGHYMTVSIGIRHEGIGPRRVLDRLDWWISPDGGSKSMDRYE